MSNYRVFYDNRTGCAKYNMLNKQCEPHIDPRQEPDLPSIQQNLWPYPNSITQGKTDFELHNSEQTEVILNILSYSGIIIRDPQIAQQAAQIVGSEDANEKS